MVELQGTKERLAAILVGDVVGYTRLMHADERTTIKTLEEFRGVFRDSVESHGGRIVDMAGDSILAVFETASGAVIAATEAQGELARRNEVLPEERRMMFRVGVNLGDIIEKEDGSVYGDGVNVAARLQSTSDAGGINVSGTVFESVRSKVSGPFIFLGEQQLKNVKDPVAVYRIGAAAKKQSHGNGHVSSAPNDYTADRPTVLVEPLKVISGDAETESLAEALQNDIADGLTKQSAIRVISYRDGTDPAKHGGLRSDFRLEGSVRASGGKLRLFFTLFDTHAKSQVWSERYSRLVDDIFELEDEISLNVTATVRLRIKAREFEKLRDTKDDALSVPQLLSKAAGYFVTSSGLNTEAAQSLECALHRAPDDAMAVAMMVFCGYREAEFSAFDLSNDNKDDLNTGIVRALSLDPSSFFAHLISAIVQQDLYGDFETALVHAETSLELNSGFSQATAMVGIAKFHLGEAETGRALLTEAMAAAPEDPHRFRHMRELALVHFAADETEQAASILNRAVHQAPELGRNQPILAALQWCAGQKDRASKTMDAVLERHPELTRQNVRPARIHDTRVAARLAECLMEAGLPDS